MIQLPLRTHIGAFKEWSIIWHIYHPKTLKTIIMLIVNKYL